MIPKTVIRVLLIAFVALTLMPGLAAPVTADHDGSDHPCDPCQPELTVTGARGDDVPNPWGFSPLYAGWTTVDLVLPDDPRCRCFVEGSKVQWSTAVDNPLYGQSAGIDATQIDADTWVIHNLDADVYKVTFTVYVYCNGEFYPVTATWYQFN